MLLISRLNDSFFETCEEIIGFVGWKNAKINIIIGKAIKMRHIVAKGMPALKYNS
jgi:hypothetical protein